MTEAVANGTWIELIQAPRSQFYPLSTGHSSWRPHVDPVCPTYILADSYRDVLSTPARGCQCLAGRAREEDSAPDAEAGGLRSSAGLLLPSRAHLGGR